MLAFEGVGVVEVSLPADDTITDSAESPVTVAPLYPDMEDDGVAAFPSEMLVVKVVGLSRAMEVDVEASEAAAATACVVPLLAGVAVASPSASETLVAEAETSSGSSLLVGLATGGGGGCWCWAIQLEIWAGEGPLLAF